MGACISGTAKSLYEGEREPASRCGSHHAKEEQSMEHQSLATALLADSFMIGQMIGYLAIVLAAFFMIVRRFKR